MFDPPLIMKTRTNSNACFDQHQEKLFAWSCCIKLFQLLVILCKWPSLLYIANFLYVLFFQISQLFICTLFCTRYDAHEKEIGNIALAMGFNQVSLSSAVMPMVKIVPRGYTGRKYTILSFTLLTA